MIWALAILLGFQLVGEVIAYSLVPMIPGPVIGMVMLFVTLLVMPRVREIVTPLARGLLARLSLLFVPAGVGVVSHIARVGGDGIGLAIAIVLSTVLAIAVGAGAFVLVARLTGAQGE